MFNLPFLNRTQAKGPGMTGQQNPLQSLLAPEVAFPIAAGLIGNQGNQQNFANALSAAGPAMARRAEDMRNAQKRNATLEFLRQQSPEIAQAVDAGMPVGEAWKSYLEQRRAQSTPKDLINAGRGLLFDPNNREWITAPDMGTDAPTVKKFFDEDTGQEYSAQWNANEGTWERVGGTKAPSGMSFRTNPDGTVEFVQGSGAGQKLTEQQSKDVVYFTRGVDANSRLESLEGQLTDWGQENASWIPLGLGNYLRNPEFRQAKQAADSFLAAILRKDTGAAINNQEFDLYGPMFLPIPGDDEQTITQKRRAREVALTAIKSGLGTAEAIAEANKKVMGLPEDAGTVTTDWQEVEDGVRIRRLD